jgi:DNA invertase Pin-like site-specific DNA recombinase
MTNQRIGYGRVSTSDQNLSSQEDALKAAGCDRVFTDTFTGTKKDRPELNKALDLLRDGDTLVITRLDRLGRSAKDLLEIVTGLEERGVEFEVIEQSIDTKTPEGKLFFTIIGGFAEFEREIMRSRTMDGLAAARARGRLGGRPPKFTPKQKTQIVRLYNDGMHVSEIMQMFNAARPTIYKVLNEAKSNNTND